MNYTRITIDLDTTEYYTLSHCMETLFKYGFDKEITIRKSPSKKGYHIIAWSNTGVTTKEELIRIRREAGDDPIRCELDSRTGRPIQILFQRKKKKVIYGD